MLELGCSQRVSRLSWRTAGTAPTILPVVVMMIITNVYVESSILGLFYKFFHIYQLMQSSPKTYEVLIPVSQ